MSIEHNFYNNLWIKINIPENITSFDDFNKSQNKCIGLLSLSPTLDCFLKANVLWVYDSFNNQKSPGLYVFEIKELKNPSISGSYSGFNLSLFYNETYLMDNSEQGIFLIFLNYFSIFF